ncbi:glyoxalase [Haliscomenobacter sp.]|uniref:glyoxalase n=1 Tax=Haliscomenobacter sp. TaxID=2717303 RepID=UPI003BA99430
MRSQQLSSIRPNLDLDSTQSTPAEQFQNQTLRPILKFQHELLVVAFRAYIDKRHGVFFQLSAKDRVEWIKHSLQKDQSLRNTLTGMVIGHFSLEEWDSFQANEAEHSRRLIQMLIQRLQSAVESFKNQD